MCPLGAGHWLVQQHRVECGSLNGQTIPAGYRKIRMEQTAMFQKYRSHDSSLVESLAQHQSFRSQTLRSHQVSDLFIFISLETSLNLIFFFFFFFFKEYVDEDTASHAVDPAIRALQRHPSAFPRARQERGVSLLRPV